MVAPAAIEPIPQKMEMDCVIAALAAVLGLPYQSVVDAAKAVDPLVLTVGLTPAETRRCARKLGRELAYAPTDDLDESTGVLFHTKGRYRYHAVVLFSGVIYDPASGLLYQPDAYFATFKYKPFKLLVP